MEARKSAATEGQSHSLLSLRPAQLQFFCVGVQAVQAFRCDLENCHPNLSGSNLHITEPWSCHT